MSNWRSESLIVFIFSAGFFLCCASKAAEESFQSSNLVTTSLHAAIRAYNTVLAIQIIQTATPDILNERIKGFAAIHRAAKKGFYEVVDEIINKGAKINIKTQDGLTAIFLAFFKGYDDIVRLLQRKHAKLESDLFFQKLAITKDPTQHVKKVATDIQLREILSAVGCGDVFMYAYPLIMDRTILFQKIEELLKNDAKFLQNINQEEVVTKIKNKKFLKKINTRGYFSLRDFAEDNDKKNFLKAGNGSSKSPTNSDEIQNKSSQESISNTSADSKMLSHESSSKESLSRTVSSATSSHGDEINSKKISSPCLSDDPDAKKSLSQSKDEYDPDEIISIDEFLEIASSISMADIGYLKAKFKEHKPICNNLLHNMLAEFASTQFPAGTHSKAELKNLYQLLKMTKASSSLREKIWIALRNKQKKNDEIKKKLGEMQLPLPLEIKLKKADVLSELKTLWLSYKTKKLALLFTAIDAALLQGISLERLYFHLDGKNPLAVKKCTSHTNARINFFAYLGVSETDTETRLNTVKKLLKLSEKFYKMNNLWGLSQVIVALSKSDVSSLINWEKSKLLNKKFKEYEPLISMFDNYGAYHGLISSLSPDAPMVPNMIVVLHDIAMVQGADPTNWVAFLGLGTEIQNLMQSIERSSRYQIDLIVPDVLKKIPSIDDQVIEEYSIAQKPDKEMVRNVSKEPLIKWTCSDLASFLYQENNSPEVVLNLLNNFFWSGKDLIRYLSSSCSPKEMFSKIEKFGLNDGTRFFIVSEADTNRKSKSNVVSRRKTEQARQPHSAFGTDRVRKNSRRPS